MWGLSYTEMAKKAEEAAVAAAAGSSASWSTTGLFNLDSMQLTTSKSEGQVETPTTAKEQKEAHTSAPVETIAEETTITDGSDGAKKLEHQPKEYAADEAPKKQDTTTPQEDGLSVDVVDDKNNDTAGEATTKGDENTTAQPAGFESEKKEKTSDQVESSTEEEGEVLAKEAAALESSSITPSVPSQDSTPSKKDDSLAPQQTKEDQKAEPLVSGSIPETAVSLVSAEEEQRKQQQHQSPKKEQQEDTLIAHFSQQIKRLEDAHAAEIAEMEQQHARALKAAALKSDDKGGALEQLKKEMAQIQHEKMALKQQMESLQKEKADLEETLKLRAKDASKASALHKRDLKILQEQLLEREQKASHAMQQVSGLKEQLQAITTKHAELNKTHEELASRSKMASSELTERRVECRELGERLQKVKEENESFQSQLETLQLKLSNHTFNQTEQDEQVQSLQQQVQALTDQLQRVKTEHTTALAKADVALKDYKKRAQHELALSQSRSASAVQAKEEAELEARAARATADAAMDRAVKAELQAKQAVAELKVARKILETEANEAVAKKEAAEHTLAAIQEELKQRTEELEKAITYKEQVDRDLAASNARYEIEADRAQSLEKQVTTLTASNKKLNQNLEQLRGQLEAARCKSESAAVKTAASLDPEEAMEYRTTIASLQQELAEANAAIEDLKDALKNSVASAGGENRQRSYSSDDDHDMMDGSPSRRTIPRAVGHTHNGLLYAMEKQAELKTAQAEINRLANMLADFQSERTEAMERLAEYKQRMESAEARLERYNKLVPHNNKDRGHYAATTENGGTPSANNGSAPAAKEEPDPAATNIEYLKNIIIRFLSAKTIQEKRALLPVIGAVLCLTPAELDKASTDLESASTVETLTSTTSFFSSFINK